MTRFAAATLLLAAVVMAGMPSYSDDGRTIVSYTYVLLSENAEGAVKELRAYAPVKKGYVSYFSNDRVVLRLPGREVDPLKKMLTGIGYVTDERQHRQDFSAVMLDLETRLAVKRKLLGDLTAIFSGAKLVDTLKVEKEIGKVIVEMEEIKGKINYYRDRFALSDVTVLINRSGVTSTGVQATRWEWIRRLGIENLVRD